jgi:acyl-CoA reductase-like NAD-dependent aldehyde dehydrogenase
VRSAGSRLIVHLSIKDELIDHLLAATATKTVGDPLDPATTVGALVDEKHIHRVLGHITTARADGAKTLVGGDQVRADTGGFYVEPTIFTDVRPDTALAREEVFGPVLAVLEFDDLDDGIRLANATDYGLAAAVWTTGLSDAHRAARALKAGTVWVNNYDGSDLTVPFGAVKQSGFGGHDKSLHALDTYSTLKSTWIAL